MIVPLLHFQCWLLSLMTFTHTYFFSYRLFSTRFLAFNYSCLDRTNVAQFSAGVEALGQQLVVMGIRSSPKLDPSSIIVRMLIDM